jgi:ABC-type uncharacterized transport system permease subunit
MKYFALIGVVSTVILMIFLAPLIGALLGAFSGWVVGWFFSETILTFMAALGIKGLAMWQIGMGLGFIGGFFKASQTNTK